MVQTIKNLICKINKKDIVDMIIILLPIMLIYVYFQLSNSPEIKKVNNDNKKIEQKIDDIKSNNEALVEKINQLEQNQAVFFDLIDKNNDLIEKNNSELTKLKKEYNEKINNVTGYSVSQLDSFFRKRYREYYDR